MKDLLLRVKRLDLDAAKKIICILNEKDARKLGVMSLDRIVIRRGNKKITAVVNTTSKFVKQGHVAIYDELATLMKLKTGDVVDVEPRVELKSKKAIRKKISGKPISFDDAREIINDITQRSLNDLEISSFITALTIHGMSENEAYYISRAMIERSKLMHFRGRVVDKHSIGGVCGDKTSLLFVPTIAAAGLTIPKTSSRAITNPAGTADRMEVLAPVEKNVKEIIEIVRKANACIIWGGSVELAPADDLFIEIERPLNQDPLLLPSVISKKKVIGSKHVVIDIPVGPEAKVKSRNQATILGKKFRHLGKRFGMQIDYVITDGRQPIGYAIGPALEAREALLALKTGEPHDLIEKVADLCAKLFEMNGISNGRNRALELLSSGKSEAKLREIIRAQGGNARIQPHDIRISKLNRKVCSPKSGKVSHISLHHMQSIGRVAGAPADKKAGILLNKKIGDHAKRGELLYTVYAENANKLVKAMTLAKECSGFIVK
ncbi:MAG: thymidine phosphorylase [Candidatus Aenigmatarchaeota archaeon]